MESVQNEVTKLADMVMCGDHPSVTKTKLHTKDAKPGDKDMEIKDKPKERPPTSYARISPTTSRTECDRVCARPSEGVLRLAEMRRRARSLDAVPGADLEIAAPPNRALLQAALGSFRWPPYLLCVWVLVLLLTHALHCLVTLLERALPPLKKLCQYFRAWTEDSWRAETELRQRSRPAALACITMLLYATYGLSCALYCVALWAVEPLCAEPEDEPSKAEREPSGADYQDGHTKSITSVKY